MIWTQRTIAALNMSYALHNGQKDKAGAPYIFHAYRVANQDVVPEDLDHAESLTVVALLHDVVEDTTVTFGNINNVAERYGFFLTEVEIAWLDALTRRDGESYMEYIKRAGSCQDTALIKLADLADNLNESRGYILPPSLKQRYGDAKKYLWGKILEY